jgi:ribose transport system permease protein
VGTQWCGDLISVLMVMNMPEYGRSIIYGVTILALLLLYGRETGER